MITTIKEYKHVNEGYYDNSWITALTNKISKSDIIIGVPTIEKEEKLNVNGSTAFIFISYKFEIFNNIRISNIIIEGIQNNGRYMQAGFVVQDKSGNGIFHGSIDFSFDNKSTVETNQNLVIDSFIQKFKSVFNKNTESNTID